MKPGEETCMPLCILSGISVLQVRLKDFVYTIRKYCFYFVEYAFMPHFIKSLADISISNARYTTFRGTHSIRQFPLHFPSRASPCAIRFQKHSNLLYFRQSDRLLSFLSSVLLCLRLPRCCFSVINIYNNIWKAKLITKKQ